MVSFGSGANSGSPASVIWSVPGKACEIGEMSQLLQPAAVTRVPFKFSEVRFIVSRQVLQPASVTVVSFR